MALTIGIINKCIEECTKSTYRFRIGAVIFKNKRIISYGHNGIRTSHISMKYKNYVNALHAEQAALLKVDWNKVNGCSILVMKCSPKHHILSNAKPCDMCQKILEHVGIKDIYYSTADGSIIKLIN